MIPGDRGAGYRDFRRRCVFPVVVSNESSVRTPAATARAIDMPLEALPSLDEHSVEIDAPAEAAWQALFPTLEESFDTERARSYSKRVGALETDAHGDLQHPGGTLPGFVVTRSIAPVMLVLVGEQRISRYAMVFRIDLLPGQRCRLRLETRAQFDGGKGRLYKIVLRGSRTHSIVVNRVLRGVKRRAEESPAGS
jgi:hypothetical protein